MPPAILLDPDEVVALYQSGLSRDAVAERLGVSKTPVRTILEARGVMRPRMEAALAACTKYAVNEAFFDDISTPEQCWALGWFYTDGFNRVSPPDARITLNDRDEEVLVKLATLMGSTRPLQREPNYHRTSLVISRKRISVDLARHGCVQAKSLILTYPHALLDTKWKTVAFLRGVLEGDGTIHVNRTGYREGPHVMLTIASASPSFVASLRRVFDQYWGLKGSVMWSPDRPCIGVRFRGSRAKLKQVLLDLYDLSVCPLYLTRKYARYQEAVALLDDLIACHYHQPWSRWGSPKLPPATGVYGAETSLAPS